MSVDNVRTESVMDFVMLLTTFLSSRNLSDLSKYVRYPDVCNQYGITMLILENNPEHVIRSHYAAIEKNRVNHHIASATQIAQMVCIILSPWMLQRTARRKDYAVSGYY